MRSGLTSAVLASFILLAAPCARAQTGEGPASSFKFGATAGVASDYIYRGVTQSDHRPSVSADFEATFGLFFANGSVASVKLPSQPDPNFGLFVQDAGGVSPTPLPFRLTTLGNVVEAGESTFGKETRFDAAISASDGAILEL